MRMSSGGKPRLENNIKTSKGFTHVKFEGNAVANVELPTQTARVAVLAKLSIITGLKETQTQPMFASVPVSWINACYFLS